MLEDIQIWSVRRSNQEQSLSNPHFGPSGSFALSIWKMLPKGVRNPIPGGGQWAEEEGDGHPQRDNATTALMAHLPTAAAAASNKGKGSVPFCCVLLLCLSLWAYKMSPRRDPRRLRFKSTKRVRRGSQEHKTPNRQYLVGKYLKGFVARFVHL